MLYAIIQNTKIFTFANREAITNATCKIKGVVVGCSGLQYASYQKLEGLGFRIVKEATLKDNQHLGSVYEKDGEFYQDAIDNPVIEPVFNSRELKEKVGELFAQKGLDFQVNYPVIMDNMKDAPIQMEYKNYKNLKDYSYVYKLSGIITDTEFTAFRKIFSDAGFNLENY